jgi:CcmD family protein
MAVRPPSGVFLALLAVVAAVVLAEPVVAQQPPAGGGQSLRAYRFVFLAYAFAWILVFGWIWAVARRLARLDSRLRD